MKRNYATIIISVILVLAVAVLIISNQYSKRINKEKLEAATEYTTTQPAELVSDGEKTLIAEIEEADYRLYYYPETEKVSLEHGDIVKDFDWGWSVKLEIPTMAYYDIDGDGEKEAIIRVVSLSVTDDASTAKKHYIYSIFVVEEVETDGEKDLAFIKADVNTWRAPFKEAILLEVTQLKNSKKFIQIAMNNADRSISYDENGLTNNPYTYYAAALRDNKNNYLTLNDWYLNSGIYNFNEEQESVVLDVSVIVQYEEDDFKEYIGNINCELIVENNKFTIKHNSITFIPLSQKEVTDPREGASKDWSVRIINTGESSGNSNINWIENQFDIRTLNKENTMSFAGLTSKISCVDTIDIDQGKIVLTAKSGYTFSQRVKQSGDYMLSIEDDSGGSVQIDNTCEISTNSSGNSVLTITFDKTYDQEALKTLRIKFGA